jgi:hypothetical protein
MNHDGAAMLAEEDSQGPSGTSLDNSFGPGVIMSQPLNETKTLLRNLFDHRKKRNEDYSVKCMAPLKYSFIIRTKCANWLHVLISTPKK